MTDTVERVTRAICMATGQCKYVGGRCNTGRCSVSPDVARAAIAAMREPTGMMDDAGEDAGRWRQIKPGVKECLGYFPRNVWQAMIDAALQEDKP